MAIRHPPYALDARQTELRHRGDLDQFAISPASPFLLVSPHLDNVREPEILSRFPNGLVH